MLFVGFKGEEDHKGHGRTVRFLFLKKKNENLLKAYNYGPIYSFSFNYLERNSVEAN